MINLEGVLTTPRPRTRSPYTASIRAFSTRDVGGRRLRDWSFVEVIPATVVETRG